MRAIHWCRHYWWSHPPIYALLVEPSTDVAITDETIHQCRNLPIEPFTDRLPFLELFSDVAINWCGHRVMDAEQGLDAPGPGNVLTLSAKEISLSLQSSLSQRRCWHKSSIDQPSFPTTNRKHIILTQNKGITRNSGNQMKFYHIKIY